MVEIKEFLEWNCKINEMLEHHRRHEPEKLESIVKRVMNKIMEERE